MRKRSLPALLLSLAVLGLAVAAPERPEDKFFREALNVHPPHISSDKTIKYDYDIVYVRAKRAGDRVHKRFYTDIATPVTLEPGADLMLLHPDGKEELLVAGGEGAVTDPVVSFDGQWVFYTLIHSMKGAGAFQPPPSGADIYKIHLKTRKIVRLTHQEYTPNTGAADWSSDCRKPEPGKTHLSYGVLNFGAYPLPGGRLVFTSNRNAFRPPKGYPRIALQLFVMDDDGRNIEQIGHLNIAGALHPVVLTDGSILFSSLENQGLRGDILWGIWRINPDGTDWGPVVSAFDPGGAPNAFHFQTQLSDGSVVIEGYYNQNNSGFGTYVKLPARTPYPAFGPAWMHHPGNKPWRFGRGENGRGRWYRMPFMPLGSEVLTPFARIDDGPAGRSILGKKDSPAVGKFTHPSGAPDNHLLTIWSPGPTNHQYTYLPQLDGGIYLIRDGKPISEPGQMLLIKNDPSYNEQWPRAVVPYRRIHGIDEPKTPLLLANDGKKSPHLPEGTPFGLVGTSSFYKRESYPNGTVPEGKVTATYAGGKDAWKGLDALTSHGNGMPLNWHNQGGDAGLYENEDIHAVRILAMEPTSDRNRGPRSGRLFHSHAQERLRILGEIPLRKFVRKTPSSSPLPEAERGSKRGRTPPPGPLPDAERGRKTEDKSGSRSNPPTIGGSQPLDPDGNPDTSFLAKIPADTAFTFQTLDKNGMVLNMAQTWHQLRPGEIRNDCGGCHAHSQKPTLFEKTAAARSDYQVWDLTEQTPLLTAKEKDQSRKKWDAKDESGLRYEKKAVVSVEYFRDVRPILDRSCVACHSKEMKQPAGNLVLDADNEQVSVENKGKFPGTYYRLALDTRAKFGHKPVGYDSWGYPQASRYIRKFQSRRSLLIWKVYGKRLDGFSNDDHPSESEPGKRDLIYKGQPVDARRFAPRADIDYVGSMMPPPGAVKKGHVERGGKKIPVHGLSDEDRRTLVRWVDLGCPIDLDYDPKNPEKRGYGWMCDDNRPVLTLTIPQVGVNSPLKRILVGMYDYYSGLEAASFRVTADFPVNGVAPGKDLSALFHDKGNGVRELVLSEPITSLKRGTLTVSVKDRQGNVARIERVFSVK
jgi:Hydrazine synthase alpha subunit middle domain